MKKWVIPVHRRLATFMWAPFVVWFASGIAMLFGGMPQLTEAERLRLLEPVAVERIALAPREAQRRAAVPDRLDRVSLTTLLGRPAYRLTTRAGTSTVFADTGQPLAAVDASDSLRIVAASLHVPRERLRYVRTLCAPDQWTIGLSRQFPLHEVGVDDAHGTEVYVSAPTGEVALVTDRHARAIAWISAVPHWFYMTALRSRERLWRQVVLWTSALAAIAACAGLLVGIAQYRARYAGVKRWHYRAGALFGPFALTWVVSGGLSMQPWQWASPSGLHSRIAGALSGGELDLRSFPPFEPDKWRAAIDGDVKEIDLVGIFGEPHFVVQRADLAPLVVSARTLERRAPLDPTAIAARIGMMMPDVPVVASAVLPDYDAYYYDRGRRSPLPVERIELADEERTIAYIDLATGALVGDVTRRQRIERWIYHGLHSLDFPFFYNAYLVRTIVMIVLCAGGLTLSVLGATMALRRVRRFR